MNRDVIYLSRRICMNRDYPEPTISSEGKKIGAYFCVKSWYTHESEGIEIGTRAIDSPQNFTNTEIKQFKKKNKIFYFFL